MLAKCRRCGGHLPRGTPRGNRWIERTGDTCDDCLSGRTLAYCNDMIQRTERVLALMEGSNAVLTNPAFMSDMDGQSYMYNGLLALGWGEVMARWAVVDGGGTPRYDALEIEGTCADIASLSTLRERFILTAAA